MIARFFRSFARLASALAARQLNVRRQSPFFLNRKQRILASLSAALEQDNQALVETIVDRTLAASMAPSSKMAIATKLIAWGKTEPAWRLLGSIPSDTNPHRYSELCRRISAHPGTQEELRAAARARWRAIVPPLAGPQVVARSGRYEISPFQFVASDAHLRPSPGTITISGSDRLNDIHVHENRRLLQKLEIQGRRNVKPVVRRVENVFVNSAGQIWRNENEVIHHGNRAIETIGVSSSRSYGTAVLSTNSTRGFYHWFAERLPALNWSLQNPDFDGTILFGQHAQQFQDKTIELIDHPAPQFERIDQVAWCEECYIAHSAASTLAQWEYFGDLYQAIGERAARLSTINTADAIYISRRDTQRRVMVNEHELEAGLSSLGVKVVIFGEMSLADQINLIRNARLVIAPHGAGLSHIAAAASGLKVVELVPCQMGSHSLRFNFARLSYARGHDHRLWLEPIDEAINKWTVSTPPLLRHVENMMHSLG